MTEQFTKKEAQFMSEILTKICKGHINCTGCLFDTPNGECIVGSINDYIIRNHMPSNAEKFKEVFGFPIYELHQLSQEEEGGWLEKEYYKPND